MLEFVLDCYNRTLENHYKFKSWKIKTQNKPKSKFASPVNKRNLNCYAAPDAKMLATVKYSVRRKTGLLISLLVLKQTQILLHPKKNKLEA